MKMVENWSTIALLKLFHFPELNNHTPMAHVGLRFEWNCDFEVVTVKAMI